MLKKIFFALLFTLFLSPQAFAASNQPTVKITSYKYLPTGQIYPFGSGSGTLISEDGLVVSNNHVIFNESEFKPHDVFGICITFAVKDDPECKYTAHLMANNRDLDLSLLKINEVDIFGEPVGNLNYLNYKHDVIPEEKTRVQVLGYPGSGGETITITQGQVSGVEKFNNALYYKTDSDIDFGNSGGTVVDSKGNYIGVPTFIRALAETVGYFLGIEDVRPWVDANLDKELIIHAAGQQRLERVLKRYYIANDTLSYETDFYPFYKVTLPEGWEFYQMSDVGIGAHEKQLASRLTFVTSVIYYQFEIGEGFLDELDNQLRHIRERFPDYKKEVVDFAGTEAWKVSYTGFNGLTTNYYIPYGYALLSLSYHIDPDQEEEETEKIEQLLSTFEFTQPAQKDPNLPDTITFEDPGFSITMSGDFKMQANKKPWPIYLISEATQHENYEGEMTINYRQVSKEDRDLSAEDRLDGVVQNIYGNTKVVFKNDNVVLDGLEGFLYTLEYEGDEFQQVRKVITIGLRDGDYELTIDYDDLSETFDANLGALRDILNSFDWHDDSLEKAGQYSFGSLGQQFSDVNHHRFASSIASLAEKEIVGGYGDGTFKPEREVSRAEALKMILESKNHLEKSKKLNQEVNFDEYRQSRTPNPFRDVSRKDWHLKYVKYAVQKGLLKGYPDKTFRPSQTVTLAEALKMIFVGYEIPVWEGETDPWTKKYIDKAYELGMLPRGLEDPNHNVSRAEIAFLIESVYLRAK